MAAGWTVFSLKLCELFKHLALDLTQSPKPKVRLCLWWLARCPKYGQKLCDHWKSVRLSLLPYVSFPSHWVPLLLPPEYFPSLCPSLPLVAVMSLVHHSLYPRVCHYFLRGLSALSPHRARPPSYYLKVTFLQHNCGHAMARPGLKCSRAFQCLRIKSKATRLGM